MSDPWRKPSPELVEGFHASAAGIEGVEIRKMFGYPSGFVNGNLAFGMYQDTFMVRLPEADRQERLDAGWSLFEPMPGRPMREYVALPAEVAADAPQARLWLERAAAHVGTLPPKAPKPRRGKAPA